MTHDPLNFLQVSHSFRCPVWAGIWGTWATQALQRLTSRRVYRSCAERMASEFFCVEALWRRAIE